MVMLPAVSAAVSLALLAWPAQPAARRIEVLYGLRIRRFVTMKLEGKVWPAVCVTCCCVAWLLSGPATAVASVLLIVAVTRNRRARTRMDRELAATAGLAKAIGALVAELRSGAHPAEAAARTWQECTGDTALAMGAVAGAARLGGSVERAVAASASNLPALAEPLARLARAWQLAHVHGIALADVLDAVRNDLDQRTRFAAGVRARMAGPRSSAMVLAGLPVVGVLLGEAMGAHPLGVLLGGGIGGVLLLTGCALTCIGILWSGRMTRRAVLT